MASPPGRRPTRTRGGTIAEVADHIDLHPQGPDIDNVGIGPTSSTRDDVHGRCGLTDVTPLSVSVRGAPRRGYSEDDLLKVAGHNHLRAMRQMEKAAAQR